MQEARGHVHTSGSGVEKLPGEDSGNCFKQSEGGELCYCIDFSIVNEMQSSRS
jgi:hypothetical protein